MRISFGTAVSVWLVLAAVLAGCADSGGSGKGGAGGSGVCGGGGAGDPCKEPCIDDPGWDVMGGVECCCPDRVCGYDDCYGGWQGVCTDGYWNFNHWDGSDDPSCVNNGQANGFENVKPFSPSSQVVGLARRRGRPRVVLQPRRSILGAASRVRTK